MSIIEKLTTNENLRNFLVKIRSSREKFPDYFLAVYVHVLLIVAIFDVYYKSPLISNSNRRFDNRSDESKILNFSDLDPLADRLVIFIADGLRSETFFDRGTSALFLKNISKKGIWGLNNCRVPTESRPGHVALLAGFYEDVSAVTRGWTVNPVGFDSIFNQSQFSLMWGSPDIVPMFAKGVHSNKVYTKTYSSKLQDFADENASILDNFVFDEVKNFLEQLIPKNATLADLVHKKRKKLIFFLHLLATDTLGHGFKPKSKNYIDNVANVDRGIREVYHSMEKFYDYDNRTAYLFLSDHGMTDWGSHGSGDPHETETPFVAWGSGIVPQNKSPQPLTSLPSSLYNSIEQIDVAPWISCLLGFDGPPYNSMGVAPVRFLKADDHYKARCSCANFLTVADQMMSKRQEKLDANFKSLFKEYPLLSLNKLRAIKNQIYKLFAQKRFTLASNVCLEWIKPTIAALKYYHQYERWFLTLFIIWIYLSWTLYILCKLVLANEEAKFKSYIFTILATVISLYLIFTRQPAHYFLYCLTPVFFTYKSLLYFSLFSLRDLGLALLTLIFVKLFVSCFFYRIILSFMLLTVALTFRNNLRMILILTIQAIFPFLPTVGRYNIPLFPILTSLACIVYKKDILAIVAVIVQILVHCNIFPFLYHTMSWLVLILTLKNLYSSPKNFMSLCFLLYPLYSLLSAFYEPLFYCSFCILLLNIQSFDHHQNIFKRGFLVVFLCLLAFFGTGNLASLNSYDPILTKPFVTVFSPFLMTSLLLTKVAIPILLVLASMVENGDQRKNGGQNSFWFYVVVSDLMALGFHLIPMLWHFEYGISIHMLCMASINISIFVVRSMGHAEIHSNNFFFNLKDEGSWLDIGTSISHYILSMAMPLVIISLQQLAVHLIRPKNDRKIIDVE